MATLSIKQRFNSIKQDKISDQAKKALQLMKEATDNFKDEEAVAKIRPKFDALFEKIKIAKPEAIKGEPTKETKKAPTPSQTKSVRSAASSLSLTAKKRIMEAKKERARQGITTKKLDILKDGKIKAIKKTGRRISQGLKGNQFKDKSEAKGNVYYEYRNNRYDKRPDSKPRLEKGGMMAKGGWIKSDEQEDFYYYSTPDKKIKTPFWYSVHEVKDIGNKETLYWIVQRGGTNDLGYVKNYAHKKFESRNKAFDYVKSWAKDIVNKYKSSPNKLSSGGMMANGGEMHRVNEG